MSKQGAEAFGEYLTNFLAKSGRYPNASAFAETVGLNPGTVSRWINGKERPAGRTLERLAPYMGVTARHLFLIAYPEAGGDATAITPEPLPELHRLAAEINLMLSTDSPISEADRRTLENHLDISIDPYRRFMRRRKPA